MAVVRDLERFEASPAQTVQFLRTRQLPGSAAHGIVVERPRYAVALSSMTMLLHTSPSPHEIRGKLSADQKHLYLSDTTLYPAARKAFPAAVLTVRAQNSYALIKQRIGELPYSESIRFRLATSRLTRIEHEMAHDDNCSILAVTAPDAATFSSLGGGAAVSHLPIVAPVRAYEAAKPPHRLCFFGSLSRHKSRAIRHFVANDLPLIRDQLPEMTLDLWGEGTERVCADHAAGHGRWTDDGAVPLDGRALFVNPDYLGGGIKLKVDWLARHKLPFITTPRGAEGHHLPASPSILVAPIREWPEVIACYFGSP